MPLYPSKVLNIVTKTANYTATFSDDVILCNTNAFTITLPSAAASLGKVFRILKIGGDGNAITVARAGSDTIEGATSFSIAARYQDLTVVSDGSATWYRIGHAQWN